MWLGGRKSKGFFFPLGLLRGTEVAEKSGTERLLFQAVETVRKREDWSGGFSGFRRGLGKHGTELD